MRCVGQFRGKFSETGTESNNPTRCRQAGFRFLYLRCSACSVRAQVTQMRLTSRGIADSFSSATVGLSVGRQNDDCLPNLYGRITAAFVSVGLQPRFLSRCGLSRIVSGKESTGRNTKARTLANRVAVLGQWPPPSLRRRPSVAQRVEKKGEGR